MIRKSIFYLFGTTIWMAVGDAQPPAVSLIPSDSEIRGILMQRVDEFHQSVGIVVGMIGPDGRKVVSYGALEKGNPRALNGDTVFEISSVTKVFTSLLLSDMVQRGQVALTDPVSKYLAASVRTAAKAPSGPRHVLLASALMTRASCPVPLTESSVIPNCCRKCSRSVLQDHSRARHRNATRRLSILK